MNIAAHLLTHPTILEAMERLISERGRKNAWRLMRDELCSSVRSVDGRRSRAAEASDVWIEQDLIEPILRYAHTMCATYAIPAEEFARYLVSTLNASEQLLSPGGSWGATTQLIAAHMQPMPVPDLNHAFELAMQLNECLLKLAKLDRISAYWDSESSLQQSPDGKASRRLKALCIIDILLSELEYRLFGLERCRFPSQEQQLANKLIRRFKAYFEREHDAKLREELLRVHDALIAAYTPRDESWAEKRMTPLHGDAAAEGASVHRLIAFQLAYHAFRTQQVLSKHHVIDNLRGLRASYGTDLVPEFDR